MASEYRVIVLRVWRQSQGVLVRILVDDGRVLDRVFVAGSRQLWAVLDELLIEFENETGGNTDD